jgi:hypothetical protein
MDHHRKILKSEIAFEKGRAAYAGGYSRNDNPYKSNTYRRWWEFGFNTSAKRMGRKDYQGWLAKERHKKNCRGNALFAKD